MNIVKIIKLMVLIFVLLFVSLVIVSNQQPISIKLLPFFSENVTLPEFPLSFLITIAFLAGILFVGLFTLIEFVKQNVKYSKLSKKAKLMEQELENIRKEPLSAANPKEAHVDKKEDYEPYDKPLDEDTLNKIR